MRRLLATRARSVLYLDEGPVVLKVLTADVPGVRELLALDNDLEITRGLGVEGVRRAIRRDRVEGRHALVLSYVAGEPLSAWAGRLAADHARFLGLAGSIARLLGELHGRGVIHKDIKPANIIYEEATERVTLIDFGISSRVAGTAAEGVAANDLEGTLAYMAPEQTGRLHRLVDGRSDLYALGATLYELLTGAPPFAGADASELVHAHLALPPRPPSEVDPRVPGPLSAVVMRLLAKDPDDRYQTATGLAHDLEALARQLEATGGMSAFALGVRDVPERLRLPERLYGREQEIAALGGAAARARGERRELALVAGYSGVGKSSLVAELVPLVAAQGGVFVRGKFELLGAAEPYQALLRALRDLAAGLLGAGEAELGAARERLVGELAGQGGVLTELLPALRSVLGEQPAVAEVGAAEARDRLTFALRAFVRAVARPERPVVLFIDDLQWADAASLDLLGALVSDRAPGLLVVGAYRDNEVGPAHPLVALLDELSAAGSRPTTVSLGELPRRAVEELLADALHAERAEVAPLASLVHDKTRGNAFFVRHFVAQLHADGELRFDGDARRWRWDAASIGARHVTDNVADFVTRKLGALTAETRRALAVAACLGAEVAPARVAQVLGESAAAAVEALWPAVEAGLLVAVGEAYRLATAGEVDRLPGATLRFVHDKVQQDAASLVDADERARTHLRAARLRQDEGGDEAMFAAVSHYNQALDLITDPAERLAVARLDLAAARKAKRAAAHGHARGYLEAGLRLLPPGASAGEPALALGLHSEAAEVAFLLGDGAAVRRHADEVLRHARRPLDKVQAYTAWLLQEQSAGELGKALEVGWRALSDLGVELPAQPGMHHIGVALGQTRLALVGRTPESLVDLPVLHDEAIEAALVLMERMVPAAFRSGSKLFPLLVLRPLLLALRHGRGAATPFAFGSYGIMLSGVLGDLEGGYRFGQAALRLAERGDGSYRSKALFVFGNFLQHWREPLLHSAETLFEGYRAGLATGNVFEAVWSAVYRTCWTFTAGVELGEVEAQLCAIGDLLRRDATAATTAALLRQAVANLRGEGEGAVARLTGAFYDEDEAQRRFAGASDKVETFLFHLLKVRLLLVSEQAPEALPHVAEAERYLEAITAMPFVREIRYYGALARVRAHRQRGPVAGAVAAAEQSLKLLRGWARHEPSGGYRCDLLEAELALARGRTAEARLAVERAMAGARSAGALHDEADACALGAELYAGHPVLEGALREAALRAWRQWGARARLEQLGALSAEARADGTMLSTSPSLRLGQVLPASTAAGAVSTGSSPSLTPSTSRGAGALDLTSALKASAAISAELNMERLLSRLLQLVVENAGAGGGALLLVEGSELAVHAETTTDGQVRVLSGTPLSQAAGVCEPMVRYVARTSEPLVIVDAQGDPRFASAARVRHHGVRSVLAAPILHQGKLLGVVYLENNLAPGFFNAARLQLLTLLSAQAAVALENARLVTHLDATVAARTRELNDRNEQLRASLDHLADELAEAATYVRSLLPAPLTGEALRLHWRFVPSAQLGGDAFGYHALGPGRVAFYLLDVAGHGVASALHSVSVLSALQHERLPGVDFGDPAAVLSALNRAFPRERGGFYFTIWYGVVDLDARAIRFASGGHPPPVLVGPRGRRELDLTGPMIGIVTDVDYEVGEASYEPGEQLFVFSDGAYELIRPDGAMLPYDEFLDAIASPGHGDDKLAALEAFARRYRGAPELDDDFSMMLLAF